MSLHANASEGGALFFVVLDFHGFKVFGLEDLATIQTFDVIYAVSSGNYRGPVVVTSGLHNQRLDETYSIQVQRLVKPLRNIFHARGVTAGSVTVRESASKRGELQS